MEIVKKFEESIADFYGAPYAVSTDCCTHAIELCLRYTKIHFVSCPRRSYPSIPMTFEKLGLEWTWENEDWKDYYYIGNTNIIDAAVYWKQNSYIPDTFMCLSFQFKKHLNLGRGGMILCSSYKDYDKLKQMSHDGRVNGKSWKVQNIDTYGYHYYMTPETAQLGLDKLPVAIANDPIKQSYKDYPDLSKMSVFKNIM